MVEGQTVYEINPSNVPDSVVGNYSYNGIKFKDVRPDASAIAMQEKNEKMQSATLQISVLQDAIRLDMASDSDAESLKSWEKYRVLLHKVDVSNAPRSIGLKCLFKLQNKILVFSPIRHNVSRELSF